MRKRLSKPKLKQPLPDELLASLLEFVQAKFYPGHELAFAKDRPRLLDWVILWPATWLAERGVTVSTERYGQILKGVLLEATRFGDLEKITYLPAWIRKVMQSHFDNHGDEIYDEAKSIRNLVDNALALTGQRPQAAPDVVKEFTAAKRLLTAAKGHKRPPKPPLKTQLNLFP